MEILNEQKIKFEIIEYIKQGFTENELTNLSKKLNLRFKDFIRTKDQNAKDLDLENDLIFYTDSKKIINSYFTNEDTLNMQIDTIRLNTKD